MSTSTDWSIGEVLKTANEKQVGFKFNYVIALIIYGANSIVITLVQEATVGTAGDVAASVVEILITLNPVSPWCRAWTFRYQTRGREGNASKHTCGSPIVMRFH